MFVVNYLSDSKNFDEYFTILFLLCVDKFKLDQNVTNSQV